MMVGLREQASTLSWSCFGWDILLKWRAQIISCRPAVAALVRSTIRREVQSHSRDGLKSVGKWWKRGWSCVPFLIAVQHLKAYPPVIGRSGEWCLAIVIAYSHKYVQHVAVFPTPNVHTSNRSRSVYSTVPGTVDEHWAPAAMISSNPRKTYAT